MFALAIISLAQVASAAVCCGYVGSFDEDALWKLREEFCSNVKGAENVGDKEYSLKKDIDPNNLHHNEFAFFAHNVQDVFNHCWDATENLITQCARGGHAHGS